MPDLARAQVRLASIAENSFNAVERIDEFCTCPRRRLPRSRAPSQTAGPRRGKVLRHAQPQKLLTPISWLKLTGGPVTRGCAVLCL